LPQSISFLNIRSAIDDKAPRMANPRYISNAQSVVTITILQRLYKLFGGIVKGKVG